MKLPKTFKMKVHLRIISVREATGIVSLINSRFSRKTLDAWTKPETANALLSWEKYSSAQVT